MLGSIKRILKKTPLNSIVFRYRHFKKTKYKPWKQLVDLYFEEKYRKKLHKVPPIEVVNFNANDICNSKCAMCNIWEQKQGFEVSPAELTSVLSNPLFKNVRHIGITGGEPTLRKDLPQLYEAVITALPRIVGLSIITNAIRQQDVINRIEEVKRVCDLHQKHFSIMVSLDGYGKMHDKVRGREGNFESAINVINHFRPTGIPVAIGCTISKVNVWEVDELLEYMRLNDIYGRFRVAEFIKRLYNDNKADVIRNFDEDEIYHLILFFYKLLLTYEKDATFRRTYKSIINVLSGGTRMIGCPYHSKGVVLNSRAELAYCAPKSKIIGDALKEDALQLYKNNIDERNRLLDHDCDNCIHDYHAPITYREKILELEEIKWRRFINLNNPSKFSAHTSVRPAKGSRLQVLITGWYGTETVGDKAILGGIVEELLGKYGSDIRIIISSFYPLITKRTIMELDIAADVIPVYSRQFVATAKGSDIVIMGGGPLMDLDDLATPLTAFRLAKTGRGKTIIYGCGLGPLTEDKYINAVKEILHLSDEIMLRDQKSIELAKSWLRKKTDVTLSGDPAKKYLNRYLAAGIEPVKRNVLTCYLREWTYEYSRNISYDDFLLLKKDFETATANMIKEKAAALGVKEIVFEHMHNFVVGNDDRDFSRYFIRTYFSDYTSIPLRYNKYLSTVDSIVASMRSSVYNICMRFHSVVFAHTLCADFLAIDYTRGGKISNFLKDNAVDHRLITVEDLVDQYLALEN